MPLNKESTMKLKESIIKIRVQLWVDDDNLRAEFIYIYLYRMKKDKAKLEETKPKSQKPKCIGVTMPNIDWKKKN